MTSPNGPIRRARTAATRRLIAASLMLVATASVTGGAQAKDCGPGGSAPNGSGSCETASNQVRCGDGIPTPLFVVSADSTGAEICNDGNGAFPLQGRAGAQQDCQCAYIDGDADNNRDLILDGWLRVDRNGVTCASRSTPGGQSYTAQGQPLQECA